MTKLGQRLGRENNFDAIRLAAAALVVVSHAFPLSSGNNVGEPLMRLSGGQMTLGHLAVLIFFVVSGFLITWSFDRSRSVTAFARNRALRLVPGLAVMVALVALVLGPIVTTLPLGEYFSDGRFWLYWTNVVLVKPRYVLPGVFADNPWPDAVNGVLWTLKYEAIFYVVTAGLGLLGLLRGRVLLALFALALVLPAFDVPAERYLRMFRFYGAGSALYLLRDRLPFDGRIALAGVAALGLALAFGGLEEVFAVVGPYAILWAALTPRLPLQRAGAAGDFSYGLYIYGFPAQQTAALILGAGTSWLLNFALAFPPALALAMLSWHLVEKRALRAKTLALRRPDEIAAAAQPSAP